MDCIYCSSKTQVVNSRVQKRLKQVWRRRECLSCHTVFTTIEKADLGGSVMVTKGTRLSSFNRDKLFVSVLSACGHRHAKISDASALTATIVGLLRPKMADAKLSSKDISQTTYAVLKRFDKAAAVQYAAYHSDAHL